MHDNKEILEKKFIAYRRSFKIFKFHGHNRSSSVIITRSLITWVFINSSQLGDYSLIP